MPSHDGSPLLEARGLQRSFGRDHVLRGVDLSLRPGDALVIAGPNGSGKTTLLRLLAGLMRPTAGEIRVLGKPLGPGAAETRRSIGLLSHQSLLYDDLTLLENLTFAARLYSLARPRQLAEGALERAGLANRAGELPRRLSRGLLQRAAIARALLHDPSILLLDEPFTGLDANAADRLRADLQSRLGHGLGVVLVTHHLSEAWDLASRIAVLVEGHWAVNEPRVGALETFLPRYLGLIGA
ncbi:MAG TPA: heme ABC exporter ATP-binding protein CcmA [Gemmatimonadales bacterium]|nr:heme ABC exporter ATP-binding protein CcmA [Gemmatimonadales bacterium]